MTSRSLPLFAICSLGVTQIIGYGTLYYSFSLLAPSMARDFQTSDEWIFAALSAALLAGGLLAPWLGRLTDRFGAAQIMTAGSAIAAAALIICAASENSLAFAATLTVTEIAANLVQYGAAFALLVQLNPLVARRSIVYLTLIAGFASTLFWPLTSWLLHTQTWQQIYLIFAGLHLLICLPLHYALTRSVAAARRQQQNNPVAVMTITGALPASQRHKGLILLLAAFSVQSLISSAILVHMVPLLSALGLAGSAAFIGAVFGPAQVASRLINMLAGNNLSPVQLAIIAAILMTSALAVLMSGAPFIPAAILFTCLFGFGNGLFSIISGTLPLSLFGNSGYGTMQGKLMSARLIVSAIAPFAMATGLSKTNAHITLTVIIVTGLTGILFYLQIRRLLNTETTEK